MSGAPEAAETSDWSRSDAYLRGIECFNRREFWESHEAWEEIWLVVDGLESDFFQGLIQSAAALLKFQRNEPDPGKRLYDLARTKLDRCPRLFMRLNVGAFQAAMAACVEPVLSGAAPFDPLKLPTIMLE